MCVHCGLFVCVVVCLCTLWCVCVVVCMHVRVVLCVGVKLCVRCGGVCGYLWLHVCVGVNERAMLSDTVPFKQ